MAATMESDLVLTKQLSVGNSLDYRGGRRSEERWIGSDSMFFARLQRRISKAMAQRVDAHFVTFARVLAGGFPRVLLADVRIFFNHTPIKKGLD